MGKRGQTPRQGRGPSKKYDGLTKAEKKKAQTNEYNMTRREKRKAERKRMQNDLKFAESKRS